MKYFLCTLLPPLGVFLYIGIGQALLNLILTLCGYFPGILHALFLVNKEEREDAEALMLSTIMAGQRHMSDQINACVEGLRKSI